MRIIVIRIYSYKHTHTCIGVPIIKYTIHMCTIYTQVEHVYKMLMNVWWWWWWFTCHSTVITTNNNC